jgi:para-nitrobenzyl esterase
MISYWTRFTRTGDPNGPASPHWPAYRPDGRVLSLTAGLDGVTQVDFAADHHCDLWQGRLAE